MVRLNKGRVTISCLICWLVNVLLMSVCNHLQFLTKLRMDKDFNSNCVQKKVKNNAGLSMVRKL